MANRRILIALLIAGAVLLLVAGGIYFAFSQGRATSHPKISPPRSLNDMAEDYPELAAILGDPALGSVYKEFLVAYQEGGEAAAMELARQRGLLTPEDDIRVTLVLDTEDSAALVAQLESAGITVASAYQDRINVAVPMALIRGQLQSQDPGAAFAQLTELEHVIAVRLPERTVPQGSNIDGEGVSVIGADIWQDAGITGAGLRIGILDMGFGGYESLLGAELPDQVTVESFGWIDEDNPHGTACAEIIHEIAPDAELVFAWYDGSDAAMGEAVDWLVSQEVDVISHSAGGMVGPRDGSEWKAQVVDDTAAQGILWVNAAGNEGIAHYQATFTDEDGDGLHEFLPDEETMALPNQGYVEVYLMWDDWAQARQDYELYLFDAEGNTLAVSEETQSGEEGQWPVEGFALETGGDTVYAAVQLYEADRAVTLDIFVYPIDLEVPYQEPAYSICPPSDAIGSLTVGAANWWDNSLAYYSSQGPTSDGRLKPEISAPTAVTGASYGDSEAYDEDAGFNGTSAACPHVAGAAALVWQAHPEFGRQEVLDYLLTHAIDLGPPGADTGYGYGRLQLPASPSAAPSPPTPSTEEPPSSASSATVPPAQVSTPTPVVYSTPTISPSSGTEASLLGLAGLGLLAGGVACAGIGLLLAGGVGLLVMRQRGRQGPQPSLPGQRIPAGQPVNSYTPPSVEAGHVPAGSAVPPPLQRRHSDGAPSPLQRRHSDGAPSPEPHAPPPRPGPVPQRGESRTCPSCGADVRPGARFCRVCGQPLAADREPRYCRNCGAPLKDESRFCPNCGHPTQ